MQTWAYPATLIEHAPDDWTVAFADLPEVVTGGGCRSEAILNAEDALEEAVLGRMAHGEAIPAPHDAADGEDLIVLAPVTASRAALAYAMAEKKVSNVALARTLGKTENAVRRLVDGSTSVKIDTVLQALAAVGSRAALAVVTG